MPLEPLHRLVPKIAGQLPLRTILIVAFVLQTVSAVGLVGYLSFTNGQSAVENLAEQLIEQVGERISVSLAAYLQAPQDVVAANRRAVQQGMLNLNDTEQLRQQLWHQTTLNPLLQSTVFVNDQGSEIGYGRLLSKELVTQVKRLTGEDLSIGTPFLSRLKNTDRGQRKYYLVDSKGNPRKLFYTFGIDNRTTPWYRYAKASRKQTWSPIIVFQVVPSLGIFALDPISDATGKWRGVFNSNYTLSAISTFLEKLQFSPSGQTFIVERSGNLVATSTLETLVVKSAKGQPTPLLAVNSRDTRTRDIARQLAQKFGNFRTLQTTEQLKLFSNHDRQFVRVTPYRDRYGLDLLIVVVVPESDFMAQIRANQRNTALLSVGTLALAIASGLFTARWITKPILRLNTAVKDLGLGAWDQTVEIERFDEVGELANSFHKMAGQLQQSLAEKKYLNEALAQSDRQLKQLLEAIPLGVSIHDVTGKVIYLNQASKQLLGIETLLEAETEQLAQAARVDRAGTEELYLVENMPVLRFIQGEKARADVLEIRQPGGRVPIEVHSTPLFDDSGNKIGAIAAFCDITDRKQADKTLANYNRTLENQVTERTETLRESERRLSTLIANLPGYVYRVANYPDYQPEFISEGVFLVTGYRQEEYLIDRTIACGQEIHPADRDSVWEIVQIAVAAEQPYECEYRIITKSGTQKWVWERGRGIYAENGELLFLEGFVTDISDRKQIEEKLQWSETRLDTIVTNTSDGIMIVDRQGKINFANPAAAQLFDKPSSELLGYQWGIPLQDTSEISLIDVHRKIRTAEMKSTHTKWLGELAYIVALRDISDRKRIEQEIRELSTALENGVEGISRLDQQGYYVTVNKAYASIIGYQPEEMSGMEWQRTVHPDECEKMIAAYQEMLEVGKVEAETRGIRKDGSIFYKQVVMIAAYDEQHSFIGHYCFMKDISDRKLAEEALRESAQREQAIARTIERMHQSLDIATIFNTTTAELQQTLKCDRVVIYRFNLDWSGEFVAESVSPGWTPLIPEQLPEQLGDRHEPNNLVADSSCTAKTLPGSPLTVLDTYIQETQGGVYSQGALYCMTEDIYNARFTPCYLKLLEQFQARAYVIAPIFCSNQLWGLLASYQNSTPRTWREAEINIALQISTQLGVALQQAQLLEATQQQGVQLQQAALAAEAANRAKSTFLANMSHELRTPLNAILGFSQLMRHSTNLNPQEQENIRIINRSGEHLLNLINQILDLAKIEVGRITLNPTDFELRILLNEIEEMFQLQALEQQLSLIVDCSEHLPQYVRTDVVKLRQVLMNLLSNAVKFTKEGGISLKVKQQTTDNQQQITIRFEVEDTGFGMAPDELGQLFQPFVKTKTGEASHKGTGLGLAISQQFVHLMGGCITVNSQVGCGTIFRFEIPVSAVDAAVIKPKQPLRQVIALEPNQPRYRILIVDDREDNRQLLLKLLNRFEFEIAEASNGIEAIEIWSSFEPHLIFMDLRMPVMDGYEATQRIKANTKGQATAIVAVSGNNVDAAGTVILSSGCDDFIRKPFREAEIFDTLHNHLGVRYIYAQPESVSESTQIEVLTPEALADLPADWVASLEQATIQCDLELILTQIEQIRDRNDSLANTLLALANEFQFNQILDLIQSKIN